MELLSVNVGKIAPLFIHEAGDKPSKILSAIRKSPVSTITDPVSVQVRPLHIVGDQTADERVHGGADKAVYLMPVEHYAFWERMRLENRVSDQPMPHGFLGENLTIGGLLEDDIFIGDEIKIGGVIFRVTQPREPCFKFNARMGYRLASKHMVQAGNCGWYAQVITPGELTAGMRLTVTAGMRRQSIAAEFARINRRGQASLL